MIVHIPGWKTLDLRTAVFDFNGTLAKDGILSEPVKKALWTLAESFETVVLTADTFGNAKVMLEGFPGDYRILAPESQLEAKRNVVRSLNSEHVVAVGNGANDCGMLKEAVLGVCVMGSEGASVRAMTSADLLIPDIIDAIDLLRFNGRLIATLRC
jgi:P-type E1-E2 ATPase